MSEKSEMKNNNLVPVELNLDSLSFYKKLFNWAGEGMIVVDQRGIILLVNHRILDLFGYSNDELIGNNMGILIPKNLRNKHGSHIKGYFKDPRARRMSEEGNLMGKKKGGQTFFVDISLNYFKTENETYAIGLVTDITDRVEANNKILELNEELEEKVNARTKQLVESEKLYSAIAQNFPDGTINVFDSDLNYIFAEGKELFKMGITGEQLIGSNFISRLPSSFQEEVSSNLYDVFDGKACSFELNLGNNYYKMDAVPLYNSNGEINRILVVEKNISKSKEIEREMQKSLDREKELNTLKSRFVSMASHEFRTPLSTILSSVQLISKYDQTDQQDKREKHIKRIMSSVGHLNRVLNDFLSLEKLESGKISSRISDFSIRAICEELIEDMTPLLKTGQHINHYCNADVQVIRFDENALKAILLNLLSNAIKYSNENDEINFKVNLTSNILELTVQDHGIGIPEGEQTHLFERFFRANNALNIQGTGLGLNIISSYVRLLEGEIDFESQENIGTTFYLRFPLKKIK